MKTKKEVKTKKDVKKQNINNVKANVFPVYKCEKCGHESTKTFLSAFENEEYRYCLKCVNKFYNDNFPKAILKK